MELQYNNSITFGDQLKVFKLPVNRIIHITGYHKRGRTLYLGNGFTTNPTVLSLKHHKIIFSITVCLLCDS